MNFLILMGSPRLHGNTAELCKPFLRELEEAGGQVRYVTLADKNIHPCLGCYACQDVAGEYGCVQHDDMYAIVEDILWADCIVLATPIYSWYCPAQMKAVLDRHYGLNKYYRSAAGSLWAGKSVALLVTHGYDREYGAGPFETGVRRLCEHSNLHYLGMYSVRDEDDLASFQTEEAVEGARAFARQLVKADVLSFRSAGREDAALLVSLYNAAFRADFLRYGECPGYGRTQEQMERSLQTYPKTLIFYGEIPVGVLSAQETGDRTVSLGCLCVIPEYQGRGIGTRAMAYLEVLYPRWQQIRLVTPADKSENIRFYTQRCGFSLAGKEMDGSVQVAKLVKRRVM